MHTGDEKEKKRRRGFLLYVAMIEIVTGCLQRAHENSRPFSRRMLKTASFGVIGRQTRAKIESCLGSDCRQYESGANDFAVTCHLVASDLSISLLVDALRHIDVGIDWSRDNEGRVPCRLAVMSREHRRMPLKSSHPVTVSLSENEQPECSNNGGVC